MAEYYLISQLPSLDGLGEGAPLPITEETFSELCCRHAGRKVRERIGSLTLLPPPTPEKTDAPLVRAWCEGERALRLALACVRAEKMNKPTEIAKKDLPSELLRVAEGAIEEENPLVAEKLLLAHRLAFLESLRPQDGFSEDYLLYYGLKLKLLSRIRGLDSARGEAAYQEIYRSTLRAERSEVTE